MSESVVIDARFCGPGWRMDGHQRKHRTGTALFTADGRRLAVALRVWIEVQAVPPRDSA